MNVVSFSREKLGTIWQQVEQLMEENQLAGAGFKWHPLKMINWLIMLHESNTVNFIIFFAFGTFVYSTDCYS